MPADDTRKVSTLQLLAGYLKLLDHHTVSLTHSHLHLSRLTQALIQVSSPLSTPSHSPSHHHTHTTLTVAMQTLELDVSDCRVLEELPQGEGGVGSEEGRVGSEERRVESKEGRVESEEKERWWSLVLRYRHFRLPRIETLLHHCIQLLGFYGTPLLHTSPSPHAHPHMHTLTHTPSHAHFHMHTLTGSLPVLLDHLLEAYRNSAHLRKELLILIGHTLIGAGGRGCVYGKEKVQRSHTNA